MHAWVLATIGCTSTAPEATPFAVPPEPTVDVTAPWSVAHEDDHTVTLRLGDTADGVRVDLGGGRHPIPGVSPIHAGTPVGAPLVAVAAPDHPLTGVVVESQGPDLVVRFAGPPLSAITDHPDAPADPAITWVRLRPRADSWRIVVDGLAAIALPGDAVDAHGSGWRVRGEVGDFEVSTDAPAIRTSWDGAVHRISTVPSVDVAEPYRRTGITWRLSP